MQYASKIIYKRLAEVIPDDDSLILDCPFRRLDIESPLL
jgi:hypothetical protein